MNSNPAKQFGFTLVEILIAFFIFVIIMAMVVSGISLAVTAESQISEKSTRLAEIQLAMATISADLEQVVPRPILDNNGDRLEPIEFNTENLDPVEFTRGGLANPMLTQLRSTLQRVAYTLRDGQLIRKSWPVLDRATETQFASRVVLENVSQFEVELITEQPNQTVDVVVVRLGTERFGLIERMYPLHSLEKESASRQSERP